MHTLLNTLSKSVITPILEMKNRTFSFNYLNEFEKSQYLSPDEIYSKQFTKLKNILNHAYTYSPYYKKKFDQSNIHPSDITDYAQFLNIPFLLKVDIQDYLEQMRCTNISVQDLFLDKTGGSTGEPLHFYIDKERRKSRYASAVRHDRWAGKDIGTYTAYFWGHPGDTGSAIKKTWGNIKDKYLYRVKFLDTSSLTSDKISNFIKQLSIDKPEIFVAYSNSMYLVAQYISTNNIKDYHRPKSIICTAEYLEETSRQFIEKIFGCAVYDRYGCRETSVIASECSCHSGLHVNSDAIFVEILKDGKPVKPGQAGEIVITDLLNLGMPLIRYKIRDVASFVDGNCKCGRGLPLIKMVGGRVTDFIVTPEGKIISGASLTIFLVANTPGVKKVQIIQPDKMNLVINIVKNQLYTDETIQYLISTAKEFVGAGIKIVVEIREDIPLAASGKNVFCRSNVNPFE